MSRIVAVVVAFHPNIEIVDNVRLLLEQVSHIVVIDNESNLESKKLLSTLSTLPVSYIFNDDNFGVAKGFNQGIQWGIENGYDYYLLMDQDSQPSEGMVKNLFDTLRTYEEKSQLVLIGPRHEDFKRKLSTNIVSNIEGVPLLITSGSLLSKSLVDKVGYYDERLFIDHVDHDFCLRVFRYGGSCIKVNSAVLLHRFGQAIIRSFLGKSFFIQDYTPFRRYYMMRNRIVLYKRYGMFKEAWFWLDAKVAVKDLVKLVLFERNKVPKIVAVIRGIGDGIRWRDAK